MSAGRFTPCVCIRPIPWRLVAAQHPPAYPEPLKFHVKCIFMKFQPTDPVFHEMVHPYARGGAKQVRRDKVDFPLRYFAPYFEIAFYLAILGAP